MKEPLIKNIKFHNIDKLLKCLVNYPPLFPRSYFYFHKSNCTFHQI